MTTSANASVLPCSLVRQIYAVVACAVFLAVGPRAIAQTTYNSATSGSWQNSATWSPSGIPAAGDFVVIMAGHTIDLASARTCSTMTINSTGALQNANGTSSTLTVTGDVTNGGVIKNHTSGGTLTLTLNGNVTNNGTWTNQTTNLGGDGTRTLTASQAFTAGTIVVTANRAVSGSISVTSLTVNTTKQLTVPTSADKITINATANIDGSLTGSGTVLFKANVSSANTNVDSITFDGNQQIDGSYTASTLIEFITSGTTKSIPDISGTDLTLNGTVTINSGVTISNVSGNNSTSTMTGVLRFRADRTDRGEKLRGVLSTFS